MTTDPQLVADAVRWRHFRDWMDESDKLRMIAGGTAHYDSCIDADMMPADDVSPTTTEKS